MIRSADPLPKALALAAMIAAGCGAENARGVHAEPAPSASVEPAPKSPSPTDGPEPSLFAGSDAPSAPPASAAPKDAPPGDAPPPRARDRAELGAFYDALRALERKERREHVRILWFGDSHGAADIWTGALRSGLQERFGDGGAGFVHVGYRGARNARVKTTLEGKWKTRPRGPSTRVPSSDGIFGLGGMMTSAYGGAARFHVTPGAIANGAGGARELVFDLCYRLGTKADAFSVSLGGSQETVRATKDAPVGEIHHLVRETPAASAKLSLAPTSGRPEFCGVVVEADPAGGAGVVLDNLGINGARFGTMLAWNEPSFAAELARRAPSLVIFQFGTNEATDEHVPASRVGKDLERAVARVRAAAPNAACLVVGPPDRADRERYVAALRDAIEASAEASGCGFWDALAAMGGPGGMRRWGAESPPRAARDGIHLTARGYRALGEALLIELLRGYEGRKAPAPTR